LSQTKRSVSQRVAFRTGAILAVMVLLCLPLASALAQSGGSAAISAPNTTRFPEIVFYLDAYDSAGGFIPDLTAEELTVLENDEPRPVTDIQLVEPGVQIIVAFNAAPFMANRIVGETIFEKLQMRLETWAEDQPSQTNDDFSLVTGEGVQTIRQTEPRRWKQKMEEYQPDLMQSKPSLAGFSQALDLTTDPNPNAQMKRAILYITPLPADAALEALPNLAARAAESGVRVFVWLVADTSADTSPAAEALRSLARETGGHFFLFSGVENLPNPDVYFGPLRKLYQVSYTSGIRSAGRQSLQVEVERTGVRASSKTEQFTLNVQPPNPMFLEPPARIERAAGQNGSAMEPASVTLNMLVEFPDGYARPLQSAELYVDGELADANTEAPFDVFTWNLAGYTANGNHNLQIKIQDALGFEQASSEIPVEIAVAQPAQITLREQISPRRLIIGGAVFLAAAALLAVLWLSGKRHWFSSAERLRSARRMKDPVTQPVDIQQDQPRKGKDVASESPSWPRPSPNRNAPAWLVRLDENNQPVTGNTIPVLRRETTFGSSPQQASYVIPSPSVSGLHARLTLTRDGDYLLADTNSVAGTWVNFSPVSTAGVIVQHGDIIHLGQIGFRFEMANPSHVRAPQLSEYEDTP